MKRRMLIKQLGLAAPAFLLEAHSKAWPSRLYTPAAGPFRPTWNSLEAYATPDWFRDAKFGMWAHWGPQCQPEAGDWYARHMYIEGSRQYEIHLKKYGHPSVFGFKDVIGTWKAEHWDPDELVGLYKRSGAKYFMALANHHDNFDLYDSRHQPWNSVRMGPRKDLIRGWADAARKQGLPFGVSVHAAHAWSWYETAQHHDLKGAFKDIPYDGQTTKAAGAGRWWEGFDPQGLYAQDHPLSKDSWDPGAINKQWGWGEGVTPPSEAYIQKFYKRTIDLIDRYNPDLVYFDDSQLPFWPVSDAGLRIAAYLYNKSIRDKGSLQAVVTGKILDEQQRKCIVWDIERGQANSIQPLPWQTDTCIGGWHYDREIYENKWYKNAGTVIQALVDIVSKNGNLMLNIPVRGDGTIDALERQVVEDIGRWMRANGESIYGTRPWAVYGEGPSVADAAPIKAQGFNEGKGKAFTAEDIRFATKGNLLYATVLAWPDNGSVVIKSLGDNGGLRQGPIRKVEWLATGEPLEFGHDGTGLRVTLPAAPPETTFANVLKIT